MVGGVTVVAKLVLILVCFSRRSEGIWMNMPASGSKCLSEEVHDKVIVMAEWVVISDDHLNYPAPNISTKVTSPYGNTLYEQVNATHGVISFTASEAGSYQACFSVDGNHTGGSSSINLEWRTGIAAKDWDSVARKEKVEGLELELRKLEGAVEAIHENLLYLRSREAEMRTVSETTNTRVASLSIMSLGLCILVSIAQILYLKRYFQKKRLI